jgi:tRNA U34 5-methylaminomethyl-2-thiouridine-forming methyltransferase MnmC
MPSRDLDVFQGQLGTYQVIETEDGSRTLKSPFFKEACHSLNGAYSETLHNYLKPNKIEKLWSGKDLSELNILEVGFGLGVGVQVTYDVLSAHEKTHKKLNYVALEIDEGLIEYARKNVDLCNDLFPGFNELKRYEMQSLVYYRAEKDQSSLTILIGDARKTLPEFIKTKMCPKFHVIYQDAFSPRRNPTLWTYEWFKLVASASYAKASLSTYCASVSPRKALLKAGFRPQRLKGMGLKREITQATLDPDSPQDPSLEQSLVNSKAVTLDDNNIKDY